MIITIFNNFASSLPLCGHRRPNFVELAPTFRELGPITTFCFTAVIVAPPPHYTIGIVISCVCMFVCVTDICTAFDGAWHPLRARARGSSSRNRFGPFFVVRTFLCAYVFHKSVLFSRFFLLPIRQQDVYECFETK